MKIKIYTQTLIALILFLYSTPLFARPGAQPNPRMTPGFAVLGGLGLFPVETTTLTIGGWFAPQKSPASIDQSRLILQQPLYRGDRDSVALSVGGSSLGLSEPISKRYSRIEMGGSFLHKIDDVSSWGARLGVGSASDEPFSSIGVTTIGATGFYSWSTSEQSKWMVSVLASNNNPLINYVPIPGFLYIYQAEKFFGMLGFPFNALIWMPAYGWSIMVSSFFPTFNLEVAWGNPRAFQLFAGMGLIQQSFIKKQRIDSDDRLFYSSIHTPLGVRLGLSNHIRAELSGGYAFNRSLHEGSSTFKAERGRTSLGNSWFGSFNLNIQL